jgi:hypothetical protein
MPAALGSLNPTIEPTLEPTRGAGVIVKMHGGASPRSGELLEMLNASTQTGNPSDVLTVVSAMVDADDGGLTIALVSAISESRSLEEPSAEAVHMTASVLNKVLGASLGTAAAGDDTTTGPREVSVSLDTASKAADIVAFAADAASRVQGGINESTANELVASIGALLVIVNEEGQTGQTEGSTTTALGSAGTPDTKTSTLQQQAAVSQKLRTAMLAIGDAAVASQKVGTSMKLVGRGVELSLRKESPDVLAHNGTRVGGFVVPPLGSLAATWGRRLVACESSGLVLQNVKWSRNPFGYVGNTSTADAAGAVPNARPSNNATNDSTIVNLGEVTECCDVDPTAVQSMDILACGRTLQVQNLEEPIRFELPVLARSITNVVEAYDPELMYDSIVTHVDEVRVCMFFDESLTAWSSEGCTTVEATDSKLTCSCNHLTTFSGAFAKQTGRFGKTQAALLETTIDTEFPHTPVWIVAGWFVLLYAPLVYLQRLDQRDYGPLASREDLFRNLIPRVSPDLHCLVCPKFAICIGLFSFEPLIVNCSKLGRRLTCILTCGCKRSKSKKEGEGLGVVAEPSLDTDASDLRKHFRREQKRMKRQEREVLMHSLRVARSMQTGQSGVAISSNAPEFLQAVHYRVTSELIRSGACDFSSFSDLKFETAPTQDDSIAKQQSNLSGIVLEQRSKWTESEIKSATSALSVVDADELDAKLADEENICKPRVDQYVRGYNHESFHSDAADARRLDDVAQLHTIVVDKSQDASCGDADSNTTTTYEGSGHGETRSNTPTSDDEPNTSGRVPIDVVAKVSYVLWPFSRILRKLALQEHIVTKLLSYAPALNRVERYAMLMTAIQTGFFIQTFLFRADCFQVPAPAVCNGDVTNAWYVKLLPTWDIFFCDALWALVGSSSAVTLRKLLYKTC